MCKHNFQITVLISRYTTLTVREDKLKAILLPIGVTFNIQKYMYITPTLSYYIIVCPIIRKSRF